MLFDDFSLKDEDSWDLGTVVGFVSGMVQVIFLARSVPRTRGS